MGGIVSITSSTGKGAFDCYLALPTSSAKTAGVVLACSAMGVDADLCAIADEFASHGYIAAAPDLFWRTVPGPLTRGDPRVRERTSPRIERLGESEADMADALAHLRTLPQFNGRAAAMGFCFGGPYAMLGPKRLGYAAGIACHGTQLLDFIGELEGVTQPVCIIWGDKDHAAPAEVLAAYRVVPARMGNVEVHIFPGILHGYMMPTADAYDAKTRAFSMERSFAILAGLREGEPALRRAS